MALIRYIDATAAEFSMVRLVPVDVDVLPYDPNPITDAEGAASFRAALNLFGKWNLTDEQASTLLDMNLRTFRRWKAEGAARMGRDAKARLSNLMGIHKALRLILGDSPRVYDWVKAPNAAFDSLSALDVMLRGDLTDLMRVRRYLDAERGGW